MIPVTQALNARFIPNEAEGLHAVTSILPIEGAKAEVPLWNRLRQGMQFTALIVQKDAADTQGKAAANGMASYQVQLHLPQQPQQLVRMQLPDTLTPQQLLQLQVQAQGNQGDATQVKWTALGVARDQRGLHQASALGLYQNSQDGEALDDANQGQPGGVASQVQLSPPAKFLQQWLTSPLRDHYPATVQAQAVVSQQPEKSQVLAQDLKQALTSSGLFYESHLKEATLGTRSWQQLLQEPQNMMRFDAAGMVSQQLQVLEQQHVRWQGEVWPGQSMQWQVTEREARSANHDEAPTQTLFSNLTLNLPRLGEVKVRITMIDGRFSIRVEAEEAASRRQLSLARAGLSHQLHQAGLRVDGVQISEEVVRDVG